MLKLTSCRILICHFFINILFKKKYIISFALILENVSSIDKGFTYNITHGLNDEVTGIV